MPKGKYRKKKQHQPQTAPACPHATVGNTPEGSAHESSKEAEKERMPNIFTRHWQRLRQWLNNSIHVMEILTILILVTYITSDFFLWRQFRLSSASAVVDQRPWVKITSEMKPELSEGQVLSASIHIVDFGKTPARDLVADLVVAKVVNGDSPVFDYAINHERLRGGMIYPGDPLPTTFYRIDPYAKDPTARLPLSHQEFVDFQEGRIFFIFYGSATYMDFFKVQHWTHFCTPFISTRAPTGTFKSCVAYNNIDDNS